MSGSGSGKVILLGEHAVVHGVPAIAAGLPLGATATVRGPSSSSKGSKTQGPHGRDVPLELGIAPWGVLARPGDGSALGTALDALVRARRADSMAGEPAPTEPPLDATVALPGSAGLGSSAALAVAVLRALDAHDGIARDAGRSQEIALAWERVFHGNPSGIDTALALAGGLARYTRSPAPGTPSLVPLASARPLRLVIAHSGQAGSTRETVARVAEQKGGAGWDATLDAFRDVVGSGERSIAATSCSPAGGSPRPRSMRCARARATRAPSAPSSPAVGAAAA